MENESKVEDRIFLIENTYVWDAFLLCHACRNVLAYQKIEGGGLKG